MQGWIKLHRCLLTKPIWNDSTPEQKTVLMTILMLANHQGREWEFKGERYKAEPGQFITSLESLTQKCGKGVSIQNVRTSLKRFEKYDFLTNESTNKNRLITIVNWGFYQSTQEELTNNPTSNQQATNKQLTTNKNDKNDKEKNIYVEIIDYLNEKSDSKFKSTAKKTRSSIKARLNEKFTIDDFKVVIDYCCREWKGKVFSNGKFGEDYLQPSTLFNEKFDERLNLARKNKSTPQQAPTQQRPLMKGIGE